MRKSGYPEAKTFINSPGIDKNHTHN